MALSGVVCMLLLHAWPWSGIWDFGIGLLAVSLLSMAVGFADDWIKAVKKRHEGLTPWQKIAGQVLVAALFTLWCYFNPDIGSKVIVPFVHTEWDLGIFYIPVMMLAVIFYVNSTNLQDGLDGLLGTITVVTSGAWTMVILMMVFVLGAAEQVFAPAGIFTVAMMGACIGYLRFNRYPAKVFMGDTGSMLIGGMSIGVAMVTRQPLLLILIGFCPIMSSVSVIMQRYYYKLTHGKRIFLMSPVHHHFEKKGYTETQIVSMYAGITSVLSMIAVLSLLI